MRVCIICGVNFLLAATDWDANVPGLHVAIFSNAYFLQLNVLFLNSGFRGMHEGRYYCAVNIFLPSIRAYILCETWLQNKASMTGNHRWCFDIVSKVISQNYGRDCHQQSLEICAETFVGLMIWLKIHFCL